ncbi:MAG: hypothetical protein ACTHML_00585 [Ginsengibacter sp.]
MKRHLLFLVMVLAIGFKAHSQKKTVAYYDAKFIRDSCLNSLNKFKGIDNLTKVLKAYYPSITSDDSVIKSLLAPNPFLSPYLPSGGIAQSLLSGTFSGFSATSIGGLDVTKYANAIADVLIDRAKQELTVTFFNRFKKFADENEEFKILFPKTTSNLNKLLSFTYPQMLPALRTGFFEDLKQITHHLDDVLELPRYQTLLRKFPEVKVAVRSLTIIQELETKTTNAADAIKEFSFFPEWKDINTNTDYSKAFKNFGNTVKLASIFSESLREKDPSTHKIWVDFSEAKKMLEDSIFLKIYLGLIYQQCKNDTITFYTSTGTTSFADDIMANYQNEILVFQNKVTEFLVLANKLNDNYIEIKRKTLSHEKISDEDYYKYINLSIDAVDYSFSIIKIFNDSLIDDRYLSIARKSNNLFKDCYTQEYTQAVTDAIDILKTVHDLVNENSATVGDKKDKLNKLLAFVEKVKPYALFMANIVEAKDEKEVKAALENVILPVGSSSIKKYSAGNISVQTYLGAYLSFNNKNNINSTWSDKFGVIAPIGLSWTLGFTSFGKGGSISLFTSLFDLGAIVDYKLKQEPAPTNTNPDATVIKKDYEVKLGQIFSPGGYLVYGFGANLPLSLGIGAQYGPGLSKIDSDNSTIVNNPSWRGNFFLAVDMPFFTLKNKVKNK